jgi:hypothetical protein
VVPITRPDSPVAGGRACRPAIRIADSVRAAVAGSSLRPVEHVVEGWSVDDGAVGAVPAVHGFNFGSVAALLGLGLPFHGFG